MNRRDFIQLAGLGTAGFMLGGCASTAGRVHVSANKKFPNIVYILADDLGYGDISSLNKNGKIKTSNIDSIAKEGMVFTDAHSGSAICTPTRYGILTGRYCWRRLKKGAVEGDSPHLIEDGRMTVASMLKMQGYHTACIGKWHLGMDWQKKNDNPEDIDFTKPVLHGPNTNGFDYSFCIPASTDMPPYVYVENDAVTAVPDRVVKGKTGKQLLREGPTGADFEHIEVLSKLTEKAVTYIDQRSREDKPFFLYFSLTAPHTPILPTEEFQGKSETNEYGDFVLQMDWTVGQVIKVLEKNGLKDNTLIIFTNDNGPSPNANFDELSAVDHHPTYVFRGHKADIFDGGHHVPFIASWPGKIKPASVCDQATCLTDLMATVADITGYKLPDNAGEDSVSILAAMTGTAAAPLREAVVHHSVNGSFAIRQGKWKLILCPDSGGWSPPKPDSAEARDLPPVQLYDMSDDIGEKQNLYQEYPDVVRKLTELLQRYVRNGRSTPGVPQKNNYTVNIIRKIDRS